MILLEALHIRSFKALKAIDLIFPARGSVLVEGWNESGKSSLFEAIIVALYGSPLITDDAAGSGRRQAESVITYGQTEAIIQLVVNVNGTRLAIRRTLYLAATTRAELVITSPNGNREKVTNQNNVTQRIQQELGGLTRDALLNSCFVEQKKLGKLEELGPAERRASLESLLNLSRLQRLQNQMKWTPEERQERERARQLLDVATYDRQIPEITAEVRAAEAALARAQRRQWQSARAAKAAEGAALHGTLADLEQASATTQQQQHAAARVRQARLQAADLRQDTFEWEQAQTQLAATDARLASIIAAGERTVPHLQQRLHDLGVLNDLVAQRAEWQAEHARLAEALAAHERTLATGAAHTTRLASLEQQIADDTTAFDAEEAGLTQQQGELAAAEQQIAAALQHLQQAERHALEHAALALWLTGAANRHQIAPMQAQRDGAQADLQRHQQAAAQLHIALYDVSRDLLLRGGATLGAVVAGIIVLLLHSFWGVGVLVVAALLGIWARTAQRARSLAMQRVADARAAADKARLEVARLEGQIEAWQAHDSPASQMQRATEQLQRASLAVPSAVPEAEQRQQALEGTAAHWPPPEEIAGERARLEAEQRFAATQLHLLPERRSTLAARRETLRPLLAERQTLAAWLEANDLPAAAAASAREQLGALDQQLAAITAPITDSAAALALAPQTDALHAVLGATQQQLATAQALAEQHTEVAASRQALARTTQDLATSIDQQWAALQGVLPESIAPPAPLSSAWLQSWDLQLTAMLDQIDPAAQDRAHSEQQQQLGALQTRIAALAMEIAALDEQLAAQPEPAAPPSAAEAIADLAALQRVVTDKLSALGLARQGRAKLASELGLTPDVVLDYAECAARAATLERAQQVRERAVAIVDEVRNRMFQKVIPQTLHNMGQILPLLTMDRYRTCQLTDDYKLRIWDEEAQRYVSKNLYSGGTRDQISLALRLAFALATLPEELGTTPGFIFLDEPLSSFDSPRSAALINLLTRGQIHEQFEQIFVISHSQAFDRESFTHHLRLEHGAVVESTLPEK